MQDILDIAFDNLLSDQIDSQQHALQSLLALLASCCPRKISTELSDELISFLDTQDTFEYNITTRLLNWLSSIQFRLFETEKDNEHLINLIEQLFALLQGLALIHQPSKQFMGRKATLQMFLSFLSKCRQNPTQSDSTQTTSLSCAILDTLLCILVDSPHLIRVFENVNGVEVIVKLLRRIGTGRSVRMKCLEFLYFYLMDESSTKDVSAVLDKEDYRLSDAIPPKTPTKKKIQFVVAHGQNSDAILSSPTRTRTPSSPTKRTAQNPYAMLKDELDDFMPTTPKKQTNRISVANVEMPRLPTLPLQKGFNPGSPTKRNQSLDENQPPVLLPSPAITEKILARTTREKKNILGAYLGNVDALIEGVAKVGVFGLS